MKTTIEHLLTPRFEVIADYPSTPYVLDSILKCTSEYQVAFFKKYPHLFKPLHWWEKRTEDEMPKYLKMDINKEGIWEYHEVKYWNMDHVLGVIDDSNPRKLEVCDILLWTPEYTYQPCSEEEFLANQYP